MLSIMVRMAFSGMKVEDFVKAIEECQGGSKNPTEHAYQDILKMYNIER